MKNQTIPDGYHLQKSGGRPTKEARDIAVQMARWFRTDIHKEQVKAADDWILEHWSKNTAINEQAHIRRAIRKAEEFLTNYLPVLHGNCVAAMPLPINNGKPGWIWAVGMMEARRIDPANFQDPPLRQKSINMTPTALAARTFVTNKG